MYVIVGDGPYRPSLEKLASDLGMGSHVVFAGKVSDEDLPKYYSLCDVFAMPSRERLDSGDVEGFGIVFLEAAAAAKPVVAGRSGGIEDAVIHGATGLLVEPTSVGDVAQALLRLLRDAPLRQELGGQARERVLREFTWDAVAAQVRSGLEQAVSSHRRQ